MIEIHFTWYVENVKLFLSQKSKFDLVEKLKNKNKKRDGKQEIFYVALLALSKNNTFWIKRNDGTTIFEDCQGKVWDGRSNFEINIYSRWLRIVTAHLLCPY